MRRLFGVLLACAALAGCAPTAAEGVYELAEFSITGPAQLESGPNTLMVSNAGEFSHTLVVTASAGDVVAASSLVQAGGTVELDVDLAPGLYSFTCRIVAQDGEGNLIDHFEAGMATTVEVGS